MPGLRHTLAKARHPLRREGGEPLVIGRAGWRDASRTASRVSEVAEGATPRFDCTWKPRVDPQDAAATEVIAWADLRVASHAPPTPWAEASSKLVNAKAQSAELSRLSPGL